ncbi:MAG TPA: hypothetical protein PLT25_08415 [Acidocella sp.]|nr:hypothetical protein [Acidocella sp.]HQU04728.1 hypothetical protein [Acidocella sp.]
MKMPRWKMYFYTSPAPHMFKPTSFSWLFAHEINLLWRNSILIRTSRHVIIPVIFVGVVFQAVALGIAYFLRGQNFSLPVMIVAANINLIFLFGLMLSRAMTSAIDVLYARGDADFLLASPIPPVRILAVRMLGVTASVAAPWMLLTGVLANAFAIFGKPQALAAYIMIPMEAAVATSLAFLLVVVLVSKLGPRQARRVSHSLALVVGVVIFALGQAPHYIPASSLRGLWLALMPNDQNINAPIWLPARAMLGQAIPVLIICTLCTGFFLAVLFGRAKQYADGTISAASYAGDSPPQRDNGHFRQAPLAATMLKNLRILLRFPGLVTQTVYRSLTLVPVLMILTGRVAIGTGPEVVVPLLVFLTGQLALFFVSIITGGDQAPELLASAPVLAATGRKAAYAAAGYASLVVMALPVIGVLLRQGGHLPALLACMAGCGLSNLILGQRLPIPLYRPAFGKTQTGTVLGLILGVSASSVWALLAWLLVVPQLPHL